MVKFIPDILLIGERHRFVSPVELNDLCPFVPAFSFRALP